MQLFIKVLPLSLAFCGDSLARDMGVSQDLETTIQIPNSYNLWEAHVGQLRSLFASQSQQWQSRGITSRMPR